MLLTAIRACLVRRARSCTWRSRSSASQRSSSCIGKYPWDPRSPKPASQVRRREGVDGQVDSWEGRFPVARCAEDARGPCHVRFHNAVREVPEKTLTRRSQRSLRKPRYGPNDVELRDLRDLRDPVLSLCRRSRKAPTPRDEKRARSLDRALHTTVEKIYGTFRVTLCGRRTAL